MRLLTPLAGLLITLVILKAPASADEKDRAVALAAFRKSTHDDEAMSKAIAGWGEIFSRTIQMHADEVAADCGLDEGQKRHLDIAAKGVSERYLRRWTDAVAIRLIVMEEKQQESPIADTLFDNDEQKQISWLTGTWPIARTMQRDSVWQQALQKSLTKEQLEQVQLKIRKRDERHLDMLTNWVLDRLDEDFLLSNQQQTRLRPLVREQFADEATPVTEHIYGQIFTLAWAYRIPAEKVSEVLTPIQMTLWNDRVAVFTEFADELWADTFRVNDWFDPDTLKRDGIEIPQTE